jgi:hypothetical protein
MEVTDQVNDWVKLLYRSQRDYYHNILRGIGIGINGAVVQDALAHATGQAFEDLVLSDAEFSVYIQDEENLKEVNKLLNLKNYGW